MVFNLVMIFTGTCYKMFDNLLNVHTKVVLILSSFLFFPLVETLFLTKSFYFFETIFKPYQVKTTTEFRQNHNNILSEIDPAVKFVVFSFYIHTSTDSGILNFQTVQ